MSLKIEEWQNCTALDDFRDRGSVSLLILEWAGFSFFFHISKPCPVTNCTQVHMDRNEQLPGVVRCCLDRAEWNKNIVCLILTLCNYGDCKITWGLPTKFEVEVKYYYETVNPPAYARAYTFIKIYLHVLNMRNTKISMHENHGGFYSFFSCDHYRSWPSPTIK